AASAEAQGPPRKATPAVDLPRASLAQRAATILHHDLRDGPEHEPPRGPELKQDWHHGRQGLEAKESGEPPVARHAGERTIGRGDQAPRERDALRLVGVEDRG